MAKTYSIEILYTPAPNENWDYGFVGQKPPKGGPTNPRVKHGDRVQWVCEAGEYWRVEFKGASPLEKKNGTSLPSVGNAPGLFDGGYIKKTTAPNEIFTYKVILDLYGGKEVESPDPDIIIDEFPQNPRGKRVSPKSKGKKTAAKSAKSGKAGKPKSRKAKARNRQK